MMRFLDGAQITEATPWGALIDAIADGVAAGGVAAPDRQVLGFASAPWPDGAPGPDAALLLMPAWSERAESDGLLGVKVVTFVPTNSAAGKPTIHASYLAFDRITGEPLAVLDGDALTVRRTAAISALASRLLARDDARRMLVLGTGQLVPSIVDAHVTSSGIETVEVWGRNAERAAESCAAIGATTPVQVSVVSDLAEAAGRADVIVTATAATEPILRGAWLRPGVHVNLLGAFRPDMRESDEEVLRRGSVFVDVTAGALQSGDLHGAIATGDFQAADIGADLAALCRSRQAGQAGQAGRAGRAGGEEITVFKSVGFASADLLTAQLALTT